jgi:hypothetical protein
MGVDTFGLYLSQKLVSRIDMFDRHVAWAQETGQETAVAIGVHTDAVALEEWGSGPISRVVDDFLTHAEQSRKVGVAVSFGTVSDVAKRFRSNTTLADVSPTLPKTTPQI